MQGPAALLVTAPASGQGKTTLACALARLHARAGVRVRAFKCGPDFLDPQWLALASGAPVHPLDLWINGEADCARRLAAAARDAELLIVEGVMGLHDGTPSAADLARRFGLPVLAVIDASAMAGTFGALVHGLRSWRPGLRWHGVLANRVGGDGHAALLQEALAPEDGWLGHLPRDASFALPERHLGLADANELPDALARLDAVADVLARTPLGRCTPAGLPRWQPPALPALAALPRLLDGVRIAVARDAAFSFVYPANLDVLLALGACIEAFSPLAGDPLPPCDAVWLPGGYPELHAAALASRHDLRDQLAAHVRAGRALWAECGGMMALAETLVDAAGVAHAMWGLLPGTATVGARLAALGPQRLRLGDDELRGHTFHWSRLQSPLAPFGASEPAHGGRGGEPVYVHGALRASWFHPWFASAPAAAARLFSPQPW